MRYHIEDYLVRYRTGVLWSGTLVENLLAWTRPNVAERWGVVTSRFNVSPKCDAPTFYTNFVSVGIVWERKNRLLYWHQCNRVTGFSSFSSHLLVILYSFVRERRQRVSWTGPDPSTVPKESSRVRTRGTIPHDCDFIHACLGAISSWTRWSLKRLTLYIVHHNRLSAFTDPLFYS